MVVDWERVAKVAGRGFLLFLEYCIKLSAFVVTAVVLTANGTFGTKLSTGFASISPSLRKLFNAPGDILEAGHLINQYHAMPAEAFEAQYGAGAINGVLAYLNGGITYLEEVGQSFASQPFATFFASILAFFSLYILSLVIRFARQKGQGSFLNRLERRLGEKVFESEEKKPRRSKVQSTAASKSRSRKKSKLFNRNGNGNGISNGRPGKSESKVNKAFGGNSNSNGKVNKHLQDYLKSAQGG